MARYGCLVIGVILALLILFGIVYLWSGWLNRPVGRIPAVPSTIIPAVPSTIIPAASLPSFPPHTPVIPAKAGIQCHCITGFLLPQK